MILSRRWRRHRHLAPPLALLGATLAMGAAVITLGAAGTGHPPAYPPVTPSATTSSSTALRPGPYASLVAVNLTVHGVPAIGQPAFAGRLGTADTEDAADGRRADYSHDPDHVKSLVTVAKPSGGTSGDAWDATSDTDAFGMALAPRGPELLRIATLRTDARCRPPRTRNTLTEPTIAGIPIGDGAKRVPVTGAQLGYDRVSTGVLNVTMTRVQRTTPATAEARAEIAIDGTLYDETSRIYSGPIARLVLGDVHAQCTGASPSSTPRPTPRPAELSVRKTVDKDHVRAGGVVRYTLTVENDGGKPMDAHFVDNMARILRRGDYNGDATATRGRVAYLRPRLTWTGRLAPGQKAKVTFTATARRVGTMRNVVIWGAPSGHVVTKVIPRRPR
ncbi:DUF7927 domain-containing protein [Actinomadura harenae]|uniref:DUF11 domain-containing protein n=1 Tax=Actinomadura harenae TaxID=2483351 RepID=A0A3M2LZJ5_9ACTN|nr:DUF11 domain-containing protein [Actinomadura harenae]RMI41485.1 DUF11 domain-containing protein [Actinomadura harenae]